MKEVFVLITQDKSGTTTCEVFLDNTRAKKALKKINGRLKAWIQKAMFHVETQG